jgi:hypothetical protein
MDRNRMGALDVFEIFCADSDRVPRRSPDSPPADIGSDRRNRLPNRHGPLDMRLHALSGGLGKPSLVFAADAKDLLDRLRAFGDGGRRVLVWTYAIDLVFPLALAATCVQAYWLAFRRGAPMLAIGLSLAALAFWLLDLAEKTLSFAMLAQFPDVSEWLAIVTADLTTVKLVCLAATYAGLLAAVSAWGLRLLRKR